MDKEKNYPNRQEKWKSGFAKLFVTYPVKNYLKVIQAKRNIKSMDETLRIILKEWNKLRKEKRNRE